MEMYVIPMNDRGKVAWEFLGKVVIKKRELGTEKYYEVECVHSVKRKFKGKPFYAVRQTRVIPVTHNAVDIILNMLKYRKYV